MSGEISKRSFTIALGEADRSRCTPTNSNQAGKSSSKRTNRIPEIRPNTGTEVRGQIILRRTCDSRN
jgi:hypothetical protein